MDLVERLKYFMETEQIASSQLADSCRIPRPTVSQILNRRNKTISDELIGKIHDTYPQLSIPWLMFGEGEMMIDSNIKISEPQNTSTKTDNRTISTENQPVTTTDEPFDDVNIFQPENLNGQQNSSKPPVISFAPQAHKRITSIVVFYDDSSFESFAPAQ